MKKLAILPVAAAAMGLLVFSAPGPAAAQSDQPENPGFMAAKGRVTFQRYCANCHGKLGAGDGNIADLLKVPPADLTKIADRNDGVFPAEEVEKYVDGREEVKAHGPRDMPIWGEVFKHPLTERSSLGDEAAEERAHRMVRELIAFLQIIQDPPPTQEAAEGN